MPSPTAVPSPTVLQPSLQVHTLPFSIQDQLTLSAQTLLPSQIPNTTNSPSDGLSGGAIAGVVVGGVVGAIVVGHIVVGAIVILLYKKKKGKCLPSCNYFV